MGLLKKLFSAFTSNLVDHRSFISGGE